MFAAKATQIRKDTLTHYAGLHRLYYTPKSSAMPDPAPILPPTPHIFDAQKAHDLIVRPNGKGQQR